MAGPKASPRAPKGARHHAPATATGTILPGAWVAEGCACGDLPEPKSREKIPALADTQLPGRICFWVWQHPDRAGLGAAIPSPAPRTGSLRNQPCSPSAPLRIPQHLPPHAPSSGRVPSIRTPMPMEQPGQRYDCRDPAAPDPSLVPKSTDPTPRGSPWSWFGCSALEPILGMNPPVAVDAREGAQVRTGFSPPH